MKVLIKHHNGIRKETHYLATTFPQHTSPQRALAKRSRLGTCTFLIGGRHAASI